MNTKTNVDVLEVMRLAALDSDEEGYHQTATIIREARAAVAELIEAAQILKFDCNRSSAARTRAESWRRLDRALARVGGGK